MSESPAWPPVLPSTTPPSGDHNANPPDIGLLALLREDFQTHEAHLFDQGFWAIAVHRLGNWRMGIRRRWLRLPLSLGYQVLAKLVEWLCGIRLPYTVVVGRRVRLWHFGGMILVAERIGDDTQIRQNTTLGLARPGEFANPIIGARVDIGAGACILGGVVIGDDAAIGANAVVLDHVPPGGVAVGVPARIVKVRKVATPETASRP